MSGQQAKPAVRNRSRPSGARRTSSRQWRSFYNFYHFTPGPRDYLRAARPGPFFFTFGLWEPRGSVRLGFGGRFLRASRFNFFRSALSSMFFVFTGSSPAFVLR